LSSLRGGEIVAKRSVFVGTLTLVGLLLLSLGSAQADTAPPCPRTLNDAQPGPTLNPPVALSASPPSAQKQVNFDTDREPKTVSGLSATADSPLPKDLTPAQFNFDSVLSRSGDTLESTDFPNPTFSNPRISPDRKTVFFSACLDPKGISAGKYVGTITVSGPAGLGAASVNLTINAKKGTFFWVWMIATLSVAFALLLIKDAATAYPNVSSNWGKAVLVPISDPRWWAATLVALGGALGIMYGVYANDPSWGASELTAAFALVGSGLGAIGAQSIVTALTPANK
jgi:hypothetical protein